MKNCEYQIQNKKPGTSLNKASLACQNRDEYISSSFCNSDCLGDQALKEQGSRNPSQFYGDTSITSFSSGPSLEDPSGNAYPAF